MSVSINCADQNICNPAFKGKLDKTNQGTPYYKTNSGTVAGGILALPAALCWLSVPDIITELKIGIKLDEKNAKKLDEVFKSMPAYRKKYAIPLAAMAAGLTLGCGVLVDYKRNKKAQETADFARQVGTKQAIIQGDRVALSNKGHAYYESNQGVKYGALLGAGCGAINAFMFTGKNTTIGGIIGNAIIFALGGLIMGKIADSNSNNSARKNA